MKIVDPVLGTVMPGCEFVGISRGWCPARKEGGGRWGRTWVGGREHPFGVDVDFDFDGDVDGDGEGFGEGRRYEFVNVLWVERREGVAYRRGLGRVRREAWDGGVEAVEEGEREVDVLLG